MFKLRNPLEKTQDQSDFTIGKQSVYLVDVTLYFTINLTFFRKGYYSINLMAIVDHNTKIRYFTARHAGSSHDSKIFKESFLYAKLNQEFQSNNPMALMGDEGYACESIMIPPIRQQQIDRENDPTRRQKMANFNSSHKKTRLLVEHAFGTLKKRWPALLYKLRSTKLENVQAIIAAAVVLHNMLIDFKDPKAYLAGVISNSEYESLALERDANDNSERFNEKCYFRNYILNHYF